MADRLKNVFRVFPVIITFVTFGTAAYIGIFWGDIKISYQILWQILAVSAATSASMLLYSGKPLKKKQELLSLLIQYIYILAVVLGFGFYWEWFLATSPGMVAGMVAVITLIFFSVVFYMKYRTERMAKLLNDKLDQYVREQEL